MMNFVLTYSGALLVSGLLWGVLIVLKIRPRCANCLMLERAAAGAAVEVLQGRKEIAKLKEDYAELREENKALVERLFFNSGIKDPKAAVRERETKEEREAKEKHLEELSSRGGAQFGGAD